VTLTTDSGKILAKLHAVQPKGELQLLSGIKIAHLALKHRIGKNHKTRIVVFIGSPVEVDEKELVKVAKKLKKEKVSVDVVSFGEDEVNKDILQKFVETVNGRDGSGSHLVTIPPGPHLSDALVSSPIVQVLIVLPNIFNALKLIFLHRELVELKGFTFYFVVRIDVNQIKVFSEFNPT
jgi:26S proteasome regulatory subunit N10